MGDWLPSVITGVVAGIALYVTSRRDTRKFRDDVRIKYDERTFHERREAYVKYLICLNKFEGCAKRDWTQLANDSTLKLTERVDVAHVDEHDSLVEAYTVLRIAAADEAVRIKEEQCTDEAWNFAKRVRDRTHATKEQFETAKRELGVTRKALRELMLTDLNRFQNPPTNWQKGKPSRAN